MPRILNHGGLCCGMRHMQNFFGYETVEQIKQLLEQVKENRRGSMLVEAVVTNSQLRLGNLGPNLERAGFKLVSRFKNPNSGNICNVFHYNKYPKDMKRLPYKHPTD